MYCRTCLFQSTIVAMSVPHFVFDTLLKESVTSLIVKLELDNLTSVNLTIISMQVFNRTVTINKGDSSAEIWIRITAPIGCKYYRDIESCESSFRVSITLQWLPHL